MIADSSWLNLVERFSEVITEKQILRGIFSSVKELERRIMEFIDARSQHPKPFIWTKTTDAMMKKNARALQALV